MRPLKTNSLSLNQVLIIIVCLILFAVAGSYVAFSSHAATTTKPTGIVSLSVSPASGRLAHGDNLNLQIWENSYTQSVNAVQADLNYDATKLTFVSIDTSSSAFDIEAQSTGGNGLVQIGRGQRNPLSGNQLVAIVNFSVSGSGGKTAVSFASSSKLASAVDNTNILAKTYSGSYNISR